MKLHAQLLLPRKPLKAIVLDVSRAKDMNELEARGRRKVWLSLDFGVSHFGITVQSGRFGQAATEGLCAWQAHRIRLEWVVALVVSQLELGGLSAHPAGCCVWKAKRFGQQRPQRYGKIFQASFRVFVRNIVT